MLKERVNFTLLFFFNIFTTYLLVNATLKQLNYLTRKGESKKTKNEEIENYYSTFFNN